MLTRTRALLISVLSVTLMHGNAGPQTAGTQAVDPEIPRGIWELANPEGGAVGINLWPVAASVGHGGPLLKAGEKDYDVLQAGIYQRTQARVKCGEENFFDLGWRGPSGGTTASYQRLVLEIHHPLFRYEQPIDLVLRFEPREDVWRGRFHRGDYDHSVTLTRAPDRRTHDEEICSGGAGLISPPR